MTNPFESPSSIDAGVTKTPIFRGCWSPYSARVALVVAGISLLPFVWLSTAAMHLGDDPQWWSPFPIAFFFPAWMSPLFGLVFNGSVVLGSYAIFSWPLANGRPRILPWSLGAVCLLQTLNWSYLILVYSEGIRLHGTHMTALCGINAVLSIAMIIAAIWCWARPSFLLAISFQWLAWFWLTMYFFPFVFIPDLVGPI